MKIDIVEQLKGIAQTFDLTIEDREAISSAIDMVREYPKCVSVHLLLDSLCKAGYMSQIFGYAIWKLVCDNLGKIDPKIRKQECMNKCEKEINKWI